MSDASGTLYVVAAPSGGGKSTLVRSVLARLERLSFSVSWTTRAPRPGEKDQLDYVFVERDAFEEEIAAGGFLEWAEVHGELYGTSKARIENDLAEGSDVLLDIDVQGAAQIRQSEFPSTSVFILPPDYETMERRLRERRTESEESILVRLENAAKEVREYASFDHIVVNDDLNRAAEELASIIRAGRARIDRSRRRAERVVATFPSPRHDGSKGES